MEFLQKGGIPPGGAARGVAVTLPGGPHAMAWDATSWLVSQEKQTLSDLSLVGEVTQTARAQRGLLLSGLST